MELRKKRLKIKKYLSRNCLNYQQNKVPDKILAEQLYRSLNGSYKRFNNGSAKEYLSKVVIPESSVYAIGNIDEGYVKIGYTTDVDSRIKQIQTGCPFKIEVIEIWHGLTRKDEKTLHKAYDRYRTNGEWFEIKGALKRELLY